jgi:hypothetical protein
LKVDVSLKRLLGGIAVIRHAARLNFNEISTAYAR